MAYSLLSDANLKVLDSFNSFRLGPVINSSPGLETDGSGKWVGLQLEERTSERNGARRMETENWARQLRSSPASSYKNQSVLILNQNSAPCATDRCNGLLGLLQRSLSIGRVQEREDLRPDDLPFIPDLILLRVSLARAAQKLIASC